MSIDFWCGTGSHNAILSEHPSSEVCAACEGRAIGSGQIPQRPPPQLSFRPHTDTGLAPSKD